MNKYKIAEVAVELGEDENTFWIYNAGFHPSQGGQEFCWGNLGTNDLESALDVLKSKLTRDIDTIIEEVRKKEQK